MITVADRRLAPLEAALRRRKREQLVRFAALRPEFADAYRTACRLGGAELVEAEWRQRNRALVADILPDPPLAFIRHPSIVYSMFVSERYLPFELAPLVDALPARTLAHMLEEDPVGGPPLVPGHDGSYVTSSNSVHHLYHLRRFASATGAWPSELETIVEWGGGYGNLAKLFHRLCGTGVTYVTIDTPPFACLQWLYLSCVLGRGAVVLLRAPDAALVPGRVNVVPIGLARQLRVSADLFVSTWALNESAPEAQDDVVRRHWFDARHLLVGMHDGAPLATRAIADGARRVPIGDFLPGQSYFVR